MGSQRVGHTWVTFTFTLFPCGCELLEIIQFCYPELKSFWWWPQFWIFAQLNSKATPVKPFPASCNQQEGKSVAMTETESSGDCDGSSEWQIWFDSLKFTQLLFWQIGWTRLDIRASSFCVIFWAFWVISQVTPRVLLSHFHGLYKPPGTVIP